MAKVLLVKIALVWSSDIMENRLCGILLGSKKDGGLDETERDVGEVRIEVGGVG